jgi:integrase
LKGTIWPRPFVRDPKTGTRRPVKGSTWTWQFAVLRNGKRRTLSKGGFRTKAEAEDALSAALAEHQTGTRVEPSKITVSEYLEERWLPVMEHSTKPSTYRGYKDIVTNRIVPKLGDHRLTELNEGDIARLYTALRTSGRLNGKGGLSEASLQHTHVVLRKALSDAVKGAHGPKLLQRNPADDVARPRRERIEMHVWSAEELRAFLEHTEDDRLHAAYVLAATTGLRRGEILGLRWGDLNLEAGQIAVRRARVAAGYKVNEVMPKSGRGRTVALDAATCAVLHRWRIRQSEERLAWGGAWRDTGFVFTREDGEGVHPQSLSQSFERSVRGSRLPVIRFHDLRHTHATLMLGAGVHPKVVQERLGHASIQITLDTYSHVMPGMQADAAARTGALVFGNV